MTENEIKDAVIEVLSKVAPDAETAAIDPRVNFRDQFDFDSMDFLTFGLGLEQRLGIEIPETEYPKLSSLSGCVAYLGKRVGAAS